MSVDRRTRRLRRAEEEVALAVAAMDRHGLLPAEHSAGRVTEHSPEHSPGHSLGHSPGLPADRPGASPSARPARRRRSPVRRTVRHPGRLVLAGCAAAALVGVLVVQPWTGRPSPAPLAYSLLPALPPDEGWGASSLTGSADSAAASGSEGSAAASSESADESANTAVSGEAVTAAVPDVLASLATAAAGRSARVASLAAAAPEVVAALSWSAAAAAGAGDDVVPDLVVTRTDVTGAVTTTAPGSPLTEDGAITPAALAAASRAADAAGSTPEGAEVATSPGPDPATLPRDPAALRAALLAATPCATPDETACLVAAVGSLAAHHVVPADLTAALWQVLALEPDVEDLGSTQDRAGRPALALAATAGAPDGEDGPRTWVVLADPVTGAVLGTEVFDEPEDGTGERVVVAFDAVVVPGPGRDG